MNAEQIISTLTVASTLAVKLIGFPNQIQKIRKSGSLEGVSVLYFALVFITYILWTVHGLLRNDKTIIIGQGVGVIASGILVVLLFVTWRKSKRKASSIEI